jgi:hypothetical protein
VKAALQKAEDSIWRATIGLVFFGVPHKGLVVSDMQQMIGKDHPRQELLGQISVKSHLLADQLANFKNIIEDRKIISFYERQQTGQLKMVSTHLAVHALQRAPLTITKDSATQMWRRGNDEFATSVDEESALLQFPDNMEVKIPVNANQVTMVKFDSTGDHIYSSVVEHLKALETKGLDIVHSRFCM